MFGRVLTKIFKRGAPAVKPAASSPAPETSESPFGRTSTPPAPKAPEPVVEPKAPAAAAAEAGADAVKKQWKAKADKAMNPKESPDVLCGVNKSMSKEEIAEKLAMLYRRHNRAASSLDAKMREEAEAMLEAIASVKEKYLLKKS